MYPTDLLGVDLSADGEALRVTFRLRVELMLSVPDGSSLALRLSLLGAQSFDVAVNGYPGVGFGTLITTADGDPISSDVGLDTAAIVDGSPAVTVDVPLDDLEGLGSEFEWVGWSEYQTPQFLFQDFCPGPDVTDRADFPGPRNTSTDTVPAATTTMPAAPTRLVLAGDGLGIVENGASLTDARQRLTNELGRPPDAAERLPCDYGGPEVQVLQWGPLSVYFETHGEDINAQLVGWLVDSNRTGSPALDDLRTTDGIRVGSTVSESAAVLGVDIDDGQDPDGIGLPMMTIGEGDSVIVGALSDGTGDGQVVALAHGVPCSEDGFNIASYG